MSVFASYLGSVGAFLAVGIILLNVGNQAASLGASVWLSEWSNDPIVNGTSDPAQRDLRLGVYGALGMSQGK